MPQPFDAIAEIYDQWYDQPKGRVIFTAEVDCLRSVCGTCNGRWMELGVGTGRFAAALGIHEGIDPSPTMLEIAAGRGIKTSIGIAEDLPFPENSFDGILITTTLCFLDDPERAFVQCRRVLKPRGQLLLGFIPAESPWGKAYQKKKAQGHPLYAHARFLETAEVTAYLEKTGFDFQKAASALLWEPDTPPPVNPHTENGIVRHAGFLGLLSVKPSEQS